MTKANKMPLPKEVLEYFQGDRVKARRWFETPSLPLGLKSPSTLKSAQLNDLLNKLRHGMTA